MGTPDFAVASLRALHRSEHEVVGIVTAPDRPAGRGQKIRISPVKKFALENGIEVLQPEKLRNPDFISSLEQLNADIFVVVAFRMLPEIVWRMPRLGTFNLHASLLPQYRGAAPLNWALINGEKESGVTTFLIDDKIDTGKIILREKMDIPDDFTAGDLHDELMLRGAELVLQTVDMLVTEDVKFIPQPELIKPGEKLLAAPKLYKDDCRIDWARNSELVHNLVRGLSPYPGAWTILQNSDGERFSVKILKTQKERHETAKPAGTVVIQRDELFVHCKTGVLKILLIQPEGKKQMDTEVLLRGYRKGITSAE